MYPDQFDDLTRNIATTISRRDMLKVLLSSLVSALFTLSGCQKFTSSRTSTLPLTSTLSAVPISSCAKQVYPNAGTRFTGKQITADVQFFDTLDQINECAVENNVFIRITSSYREPNQPIGGTVVPPANHSNHYAGHAIDMNVGYYDDNGSLHNCNSSCLAQNTPPMSVANFIQCIRDMGLRWGGDFHPKDPVHIDDGLNNNLPAWDDRVNAMKTSSSCDANQCLICNQTTGYCESSCYQGQSCNNGTCTSVCSPPCSSCETCVDNNGSPSCVAITCPNCQTCESGVCRDCNPNEQCCYDKCISNEALCHRFNADHHDIGKGCCFNRNEICIKNFCCPPDSADLCSTSIDQNGQIIYWCIPPGRICCGKFDCDEALDICCDHKTCCRPSLGGTCCGKECCYPPFHCRNGQCIAN